MHFFLDDGRRGMDEIPDDHAGKDLAEVERASVVGRAWGGPMFLARRLFAGKNRIQAEKRISVVHRGQVAGRDHFAWASTAAMSLQHERKLRMGRQAGGLDFQLPRLPGVVRIEQREYSPRAIRIP